MTQRKNVLFITADQWRGECLSVLGHPLLKTPNLDRLAAGGTVFRRHHAQATPCGPSRACLHTGMYLHNHRMVANGTPLELRHTNVALETRKAGYDPVLLGYTDIGLPPPDGAIDFRDPNLVLPGLRPLTVLNDDMGPWIEDLVAKGYERPEEPLAIFRPKLPSDGAKVPRVSAAPSIFSAEDSAVALFTGQAMDHIDEKGDEPWFVHVSYLSPHPPFIAPEPYNTLYDPADMALPVKRSTPAEEGAQHPYLAQRLIHQKGWPVSYDLKNVDLLDLSEADWRQIHATYFGMMAEVDHHVGALMDHLEARGILDDTLIVFTSDHGEHLGDHWMYAKYGYFDQVFRIPLIVRDPRKQSDGGRGAVVDAMTENVDIMPTILDWLGLDVPRQCDGRSLLPLLAGETPADWRTETHFEFDFRDFVDGSGHNRLGLDAEECSLAVIRGERYKYVHFAALPPLFFDLADDPDEFVNRADDPDYGERVLEYAQKLLSWRMQHEDRALTHLNVAPGS